MPINADGVEVSPSHQIDGGTHFYAVFFTDVRIGANSLLGDLNNGCCMATAMRMYERVAIGSGTTGGISTARSDRLIRECRKRGIAADKGPKHGLDVRHGQITEPAVADAMGLPYTEPHDTLAQHLNHCPASAQRPPIWRDVAADTRVGSGCSDRPAAARIQTTMTT